MQKRDKKGRFITENPRTIVMRVTKQEKELIENYRKTQPSKNDPNNQFINELQTLISKRVEGLEL